MSVTQQELRQAAADIARVAVRYFASSRNCQKRTKLMDVSMDLVDKAETLAFFHGSSATLGETVPAKEMAARAAMVWATSGDSL